MANNLRGEVFDAEGDVVDDGDGDVDGASFSFVVSSYNSHHH